MKQAKVPAPHPDLVRALESGTAISVVGSGLSIGAGGPTWGELLQGVAAEASELDSASFAAVAEALQYISQERMLEAAAILEDLLGNNFKAAVARQIQTSRSLQVDEEAVNAAASGKEVPALFSSLGEEKKPRVFARSPSHRMLTQLGFRCLVTTNYDMLLERAAPQSRDVVPSYSRSDPHLSRLVRSGKWFILKIHGDVQRPDDIVASPADYTSAIFGEKLGEVLRSLFQLNTVFWIGYGHQDQTLNLLIDGLRERLGLSGGFALVRREDDRLVTKRLRDADITPIYVESYAQIPSYLRGLAAATGAPVPFSVKTGLKPDGVLAHRIARFFSKAIGPVSSWATEGSMIHLDTDSETLAKLKDHFRRDSPEARYAFERYGLVRFDGRALLRNWSGSKIVVSRQDGDVVVVAPVGKVTIGAGDIALRNCVQELLGEGVRKFVVDSRLITTADSSGMGELFSAYTTVTNLGGRLVLSHLTPKIKDILQITQMITVLEVFETQEEAVAFLQSE